MPSSVIVAARKRAVTGLSAAFEAADPTAGPTVTYAWDPESSDAEQVFTMRPQGEHRPAALKSGRSHRDETGRFKVVVHVDLTGGSPEEADEKAIEYGRIVEEWFADNRTPESPTVAGMNWWAVEDWEMTGGPTGQSSISQLIYTVMFNARLT